MDFRTTAIVPVAGLSSRMGGFKPLLDLGEEPLIRRTVRSALAGGIQKVCVVLGREAEAVRAALAGLPDVAFVENPLFASTDMLCSVQLAMRVVLPDYEPDALCILPGDVAAVAPQTFALLAASAAKHTGEQPASPLIRPLYRGGHGHPLIVMREAYQALTAYGGDGGLKAALASSGFELVGVEVPDEGVLLDADTPEDLARMRAYVQQQDRAKPKENV